MQTAFKSKIWRSVHSCVRLRFPVARKFLRSVNIIIPEKSEALGLIPVNSAGRQILLTTGYDARGLMYAVLELTDRVNYSSQPLEALSLSKAVVEKPANVIRASTGFLSVKLKIKTGSMTGKCGRNI